MSKKSSSPAAKSTRLRDLEDDVFDVAHNNLLRTAAEQPASTRQQSEANGGGTKPAGTQAPTTIVLHSLDGGDDHKQGVRDAVQATWAKANELQEQAVSGAVRAATKDFREQAARDQSAALKAQEEQLRGEAEQANRRLWEMARREQEVAVRKALENQAEEVQHLKDELKRQRAKAAEELETAYRSLKGEVGRVLEEQHSVNMNMAVQAAWERAARIEATAVAAARKEARAEAESEFEKRLALERLERGEEMRKSTAEASSANADELQSAKDDARRLRKEVETLRQQLEREQLAAREAESKAAKQQQQAVSQAVKAVEEIARSNQERAIARALAAASVTPASQE